MANSENTITTVFVNVLRHMRDAWIVNEQITRPFLNATQKPDVIVTEAGRNPVVDVIVITIADAEGEDCAFSADTSMTECMVVATKGKKNDNTGRGTFVCRTEHPRRKEIPV